MGHGKEVYRVIFIIWQPPKRSFSGGAGEAREDERSAGWPAKEAKEAKGRGKDGETRRVPTEDTEERGRIRPGVAAASLPQCGKTLRQDFAATSERPDSQLAPLSSDPFGRREAQEWSLAAADSTARL